MEKERQITLAGEVINNNKQPLVYCVFLEFLPGDSIWYTLKQFYFGSVHGKCRNDIKRAFIDSIRKSISLNSVTYNIKRLLEKKLIKLVAQNVGVTRRTKYYAITNIGESAWEGHSERFS